MGKRSIVCAVIALAFAGLLFTGARGSAEQKPTMAKSCALSGCHTPAEKVLRGNLAGLSWNAKTIQVNTGAPWLVKFGEDTKLTGAEKWSKIPREKEIAITTIDKNGELYAVSVSVKTPVKIAPEKLVSVEEMTRLAAMGPEKGNFVLVDSRPAGKYSEGHIPGAITIFDAEFEKLKDRLPKEKDRLIVFYCAGPTCRLSTSSARKAEQAGHTKVKVFIDGMPGWKKAGNLVLSSSYYLKDTMEKGIPFVLVDLRAADEAKKGHIAGAVSIAEKDIPQAKDRFPSDKSAPIILYANDTQTVADEFTIVRSWGYPNVSVLEGGMEAWKKVNGLVVANKDIPTKIVYAAKPGPGEISFDEFRKVLETKPADKLIVDLRDADEAEDGIFPGSKNVPLAELKARLSEIPKDKEIITHCVTGVRAEMGYNILKDAGYKVRFLNAKIEFENGKYTITKE
jgi:rhodanese-related sulfurtransferase